MTHHNYPQQPQGMPYPPQMPAVSSPPQGLPQVGAPQPGTAVHGDWMQRASQATSFARLVAVEFRKLVGTRSDKIVLACAPFFLIGILAFLTLPQSFQTTLDQIQPALFGSQIGQLLMFVAVIKLVAGEWQYKSVQPTLLVQPSRMRYLLAQGVVLATIWLFTTLLTFVVYPILVEISTEQSFSGYLLGIRPGWVFGVIALTTAMVLISAMVIAMLIPNTAAALTVYFIAAPLLATVRGALPEVLGLIYPLEPAFQLAGDGVGTVYSVVSLAIWLGLLVTGVFIVKRRDAG